MCCRAFALTRRFRSSRKILTGRKEPPGHDGLRPQATPRRSSPHPRSFPLNARDYQGPDLVPSQPGSRGPRLLIPRCLRLSGRAHLAPFHLVRPWFRDSLRGRNSQPRPPVGRRHSPPSRSSAPRHRFLYFILLDSTAMLSHCLLYHGEVSQNYDKLADLQYPTNHLDGVRFVPLRRSPAISCRLRHHQSSTVILDYALCFLAPRKCAQQALLLRTTRGCQKHRRLNLIDLSRSLTTGRPGHLSGLAGRHSHPSSVTC